MVARWRVVRVGLRGGGAFDVVFDVVEVDDLVLCVFVVWSLEPGIFMPLVGCLSK